MANHWIRRIKWIRNHLFRGGKSPELYGVAFILEVFPSNQLCANGVFSERLKLKGRRLR
jgi:hypothetical protein